MKTFTAGNFTLDISGPHPMWTTIKYGDLRIHGIHHSELRDLIYVLERAKEYAKVQLDKAIPGDGREVD